MGLSTAFRSDSFAALGRSFHIALCGRTRPRFPRCGERCLPWRATAVGAESLEILRIAEGIPAYGIDIQSRDLAQETAQDRALSFTKGCYLGQEIVERIRSRGQVHRHLRAVELTPEGSGELPAIGAECASRAALPRPNLPHADQRGRAATSRRAPHLCDSHDSRRGRGRQPAADVFRRHGQNSSQFTEI